jgi:serine/threonine-protein kinase
MAPEMALGKQVDERTDVYLLGATLHYVLVGTYRHDGETLQAVLCAAALSAPHEYPPSVPEALGAICNRATAADPGARFASVQELRLALSDFLQRRSANALAESAEQHSRELDQALTGGGVPKELSAAYQLASAARFGFAQALREYPGHELAERGARRALVASIELELRQDHARSARALLDELSDPEPDLVQRIEASEARALERERQADRLKAIEHDTDASVAHRARTVALAVVGAAILAVSAIVAFGPGYAGVTPGRMLAIGVFITLAMCVGVFVLRRPLMQNAFNRRLTALVVAAVLGTLGNRVLGFVFDTDVASIASAELLFLTGITVGGAACLARGMWASVVVLAAGFAVARAQPEIALRVFSGVSVLNVFLLALALWYEARRASR